VVADDVETLDADAQQALFIAINAARDGGTPVLAAGSAPPAQLSLREDLRTRLGWGLVYQLRPLSDAEKALHLRSEAARRGLRLADEVVWYLLNHLPRDIPSLNAVLERVDRHSLARQRPVTLPLVREALSHNNDNE
jgi:DnaA family protein